MYQSRNKTPGLPTLKPRGFFNSLKRRMDDVTEVISNVSGKVAAVLGITLASLTTGSNQMQSTKSAVQVQSNPPQQPKN